VVGTPLAGVLRVSVRADGLAARTGVPVGGVPLIGVPIGGVGDRVVR
jgi:hypothetical protein